LLVLFGDAARLLLSLLLVLPLRPLLPLSL
jgi:hypothetical protein